MARCLQLALALLNALLQQARAGFTNLNVDTLPAASFITSGGTFVSVTLEFQPNVDITSGNTMTITSNVASTFDSSAGTLTQGSHYTLKQGGDITDATVAVTDGTTLTLTAGTAGFTNGGGTVTLTLLSGMATVTTPGLEVLLTFTDVGAATSASLTTGNGWTPSYRAFTGFTATISPNPIAAGESFVTVVLSFVPIVDIAAVRIKNSNTPSLNIFQYPFTHLEGASNTYTLNQGGAITDATVLAQSATRLDVSAASTFSAGVTMTLTLYGGMAAATTGNTAVNLVLDVDAIVAGQGNAYGNLVNAWTPQASGFSNLAVSFQSSLQPSLSTIIQGVRFAQMVFQFEVAADITSGKTMTITSNVANTFASSAGTLTVGTKYTLDQGGSITDATVAVTDGQTLTLTAGAAGFTNAGGTVTLTLLAYSGMGVATAAGTTVHLVFTDVEAGSIGNLRDAWTPQAGTGFTGLTATITPSQILDGGTFTSVVLTFVPASDIASGNTMTIISNIASTFNSGAGTLTEGSGNDYTLDQGGAITDATVAVTDGVTLTLTAGAAGFTNAGGTVTLTLSSGMAVATAQDVPVNLRFTDTTTSQVSNLASAWIPQSVVTGSDPITTFRGKRIKFWIPADTYTPLLETSDVSLLAKPLLGPKDSDLQWFDRLQLLLPQQDQQLLLEVATVREGVETVAGSGEQLDISFGDHIQLGHYPDGRLFSTKDGLVKGVVYKEPYHVARTHGKFEVERVHIETPSVAFNIFASHAGNEFPNDIQLQKKYVHLDWFLSDTRIPLSNFTGVLPELWEVIPRSAAVEAMTIPPSEAMNQTLACVAEGCAWRLHNEN